VFLTSILAACSTVNTPQNAPAQHVLETESCDNEECTYTWTLVSRLGNAIDYIEERIGERNKEYTILGVELVIDSSRPKVWYPRHDSGERYVIVQIPSENSHDECVASYQLAHEAMHLIDPGPGTASYFEEGLAEYFASQLLEDWFEHDDNCLNKLQSLRYQPGVNEEYANALDMVERLLQLHPDAFSRIRSLREQGVTLDEISERHLSQLFPNISAALVTAFRW
jgi:hypothetical protein